MAHADGSHLGDNRQDEETGDERPQMSELDFYRQKLERLEAMTREDREVISALREKDDLAKRREQEHILNQRELERKIHRLEYRQPGGRDMILPRNREGGQAVIPPRVVV